MPSRTIRIETDQQELVFEACIEMELHLRDQYRKLNNFVQGLISGNPELKVRQKELADIQSKLERLHRTKYLFTYVNDEDIPEGNSNFHGGGH